MARKYRFSPAERYGVWEAHNCQCFWCGHPVSFLDTTIDHVIPEVYEYNEDDFRRIQTSYGLPNTFQINGFENWVPAHSYCNARKGRESVWSFTRDCGNSRKGAERVLEAQRKCEKLLADKKNGAIVAWIESAVSRKIVSVAEIEALIHKIESEAYEINRGSPLGIEDALGSRRRDVPEGWDLVRVEGRLLFLEKRGCTGFTSADFPPDPSWQCAKCRFTGHGTGPSA